MKIHPSVVIDADATAHGEPVQGRRVPVCAAAVRCPQTSYRRRRSDPSVGLGSGMYVAV